MYDVVIIGAGPAGLMAASKLPKSFSFIVIDGKEKIGLPLKCGEGVREREFVRLFGKRDFSFIRNEVHKHEIRYKDVGRVFKADYLQLDRPKFEKWLAKDIRGRVKLDVKCKDVIVKKDYAEVITTKGVLRAKLVILCCGCNFNVQRKYKLIKKEPVLFVCYGGIYKNHGLKADRFYAYFDEKYFGYLWIFPKNKEIANVGFITVAKGINVKDVFIEFVKKINLRLKRISEYAGVVPCSGPIYKTYYDRLLVCGDAAGMVYAGTGEGIYFALESGRIAAEMAVKALEENKFDDRFLKGYEVEWKKSFGRLMEAGLVFYDLQYLAFRMKKMKELFTIPTNNELKTMINEGKVPFRARVLRYLDRGLRKIF